MCGAGILLYSASLTAMSVSVLLAANVVSKCQNRSSRKFSAGLSSRVPILERTPIIDEEHGADGGNDSIFSYYGTFPSFSGMRTALTSELLFSPRSPISMPKKLLRWPSEVLPSMPESFADTYKLIKTFPRISMAPVHLVKHRKTGKQLIIKQLRNHIFLADRALPAEAYFLTNVLGKHKNILGINTVHAASDGIHRPYSNVEMDFCSGGDLYNLIGDCNEQGKQVPVEFILHFVSSIIDALAFIHHGHISLDPETGRPIIDAEQSVVLHCDIKPDNIFLDFGEDSAYCLPEIKLADFGLAGFEGIKGIRGTRSYFPPVLLQADIRDNQSGEDDEEVANTSFCSKQSDMYSFAATLYELIFLDRYRPDVDIEAAFWDSHVSEHVDILFILQSGLSQFAQDRDSAKAWHYVSWAFKQKLQLWHDAGGRLPVWFGRGSPAAWGEESCSSRIRTRNTSSKYSVDDRIFVLEDSALQKSTASWCDGQATGGAEDEC